MPERTPTWVPPRVSWRVIGYAVTTAGVLTLLALALGAILLVSVHHFLEETRGDWTQSRRAAILPLERYWLFGDPSENEAFREAMARHGPPPLTTALGPAPSRAGSRGRWSTSRSGSSR